MPTPPIPPHPSLPTDLPDHPTCPRHSATLEWCLNLSNPDITEANPSSVPPCQCSECLQWVQFHGTLEAGLILHFKERALPPSSLRRRIHQSILEHPHHEGIGKLAESLTPPPYVIASHSITPGFRSSPLQIILQLVTPLLQVVPWIFLPPWFLYHALDLLPWKIWSQNLVQAKQSLLQALDQFPILQNLPLDYTLLAIPILLLLASLVSLPYLTRNAHRILADF